jgi:hypothetical protein
MPAEKQPGRHHIEWLEPLVYPAENLLKVRQYGPGELIDQKCAIGMKDRMGFAENELPYLRRDGGIRDARDNVVGVGLIETCQRRIGFDRRTVYHMQAGIVDFTPEESDKVGVGLQSHKGSVRTHTPEYLRSEGADPGSVFQEHLGPGPVHFTEDFVDEEPGAWDQAPQHFRVLDEIASEQQNLL